MVIINVCDNAMMQLATHTTETAITFVRLVHGQLIVDGATFIL